MQLCVHLCKYSDSYKSKAEICRALNKTPSSLGEMFQSTGIANRWGKNPPACCHSHSQHRKQQCPGRGGDIWAAVA